MNEPTEWLDGGGDRHGIAVFVSLAAAVLGIIHYGLRWGLFDNDPAEVLRVVFLAFFVLLAPSGVRILLSTQGVETREKWFFSHPAVSLFALALVVLGGLAQSYLSISLRPLFCAVGALLGALVFSLWLVNSRAGDRLILMVAAVAMGLSVAGLLYGNLCHHPLIMEALAVGRSHLDLLCISATTNMIETYGVPSTGLDGLPYYSYHWGSWWIFAQFCSLLDMGPMRFLSLGFPVIFITLLLQSVLVFAVEFHRTRGQGCAGARALVSDPVFWAIIVVAITGFVPKSLQSNVMMGPARIASESYSVAVTFAFMAFSLSLFLRPKMDHPQGPWKTRELVLVLILAPALLGLITITKLSIGFIVAVVSGYFFIRFRLYRSAVFTAAMALCAIVALIAVKYTFWPSNLSGRVPTGLYPLHFLRAYIDWKMWPAFIVGHFFWSWLFIFTALYFKGIRSFTGLRRAVADREMVDVEFALCVMVVSAAPGLLMAIGDANAAYFSDFQSWVSLALILGSVDRLRSIAGASDGSTGKRAARRLAWSAVVIVAVGVACNMVHSLAVMGYYNLSFRNCLYNGARVESSTEIGCGGKAMLRNLKAGLSSSLTHGDPKRFFACIHEEIGPLFSQAQKGLEAGPSYPMMSLLQQLALLPRSEKRRALLFIPQNRSSYWRLIEPDMIMALDYPGCKAVPFIAPAVTGLAMLDGMPQVGCDTTVYGFDCYTRRSSVQTLDPDNREELCARARSKGFSHVLVIDENAEGKPSLRRVDCEGAGVGAGSAPRKR